MSRGPPVGRGSVLVLEDASTFCRMGLQTGSSCRSGLQTPGFSCLRWPRPHAGVGRPLISALVAGVPCGRGGSLLARNRPSSEGLWDLQSEGLKLPSGASPECTVGVGRELTSELAGIPRAGAWVAVDGGVELLPVSVSGSAVVGSPHAGGLRLWPEVAGDSGGGRVGTLEHPPGGIGHPGRGRRDLPSEEPEGPRQRWSGHPAGDMAATCCRLRL